MPQRSSGQIAIDTLAAILSRVPDAPLKFERRESSIVVTPTAADTFAVSIYDEGEESMVSANRWHSHYEDPEQAAACAMWLLTPYYRIVEELKGGQLVATWIEAYESEGWEAWDPVYFLNPDDVESWEQLGNESIARRVLQQSAFPSPQPYEEIVEGAELDEDGMPVGCRVGVEVIAATELIGHRIGVGD